ncbi:MAG: cobalt transporter CbiM [Campylobacteraceae bacterium]|jgi:cobalt/nickel transport system permease protein|nr:cobalt transporter CbiM [Campylobacteraceae bacterium]
MHISEGVLRPEILVAGAVISAAVTIYALKILKNEEIPKVSAFSALFFLASFVHIPIGVTSVHLILNGIVGAVLGIRAFIAIFVALLLQGLLFGYGGITTLGINLFTLATPALVGYWLFNISYKKVWQKQIIWFFVGFLPITFGALLLSLVLSLNGDEKGFLIAAKIAFLAHIPIMIVEGIITLLALNFIEKVKPSFIRKQDVA